MSKTYIVIPINSNSSIYTDKKYFFKNNNKDKLNLIKFNINNNIDKINFNFYKNKNFLDIKININKLNLINIKKIIFKNIINSLKKGNFYNIIELLPLNYNNYNFNYINFMYEIIDYVNGKIIIEIFINDNNKLFLIKKYIKYISYFKKIFNKKIYFIISNLIKNNTINYKNIFFKINKFISKNNLNIFKYIPIYSNINKNLDDILYLLNNYKIENKNFYKNYIINEIYIYDKNDIFNIKNFKNKKKYLILFNEINIYSFNFILKYYNLNNFIFSFSIDLNNRINNESNLFIKILKKIKKIFFIIIYENISNIINILNLNVEYYNTTDLFTINKFLNKKYDIIINKKYYISNISSNMFKDYIFDASIKSLKKNILFHEWYDVRILKSIEFCNKNNIANCNILGNKDKINKFALENNIKLNENINIINPDNLIDKYIYKLLNIRKNKNLTLDQAKIQILDKMTLCTLMLHDDIVDGIVAGSVNTTSNTLRPAIQIIKTKSEYSIVSSIFIILLKNKITMYSDCAININPDYKQLYEIIYQSYIFSNSLNIFPKIALLSYSTYNSAKGESVEKIIKAKNKILKKYPNINIDGPIQYDASVSKNISLLKCPNSILNGKSNIFIFPNLDSGNITYKAIQRVSNSISIGPIVLGLNKPVNDLSRGCSVEDIIYTTAITVIQNNLN